MSGNHFDVVIVGAGLSGVGAACHLRQKCPDKDFAILEARDSMGGTWDLFRYPGIRSDSDMHTMGYEFRPWPGDKVLADGPAILNYVKETAAENGIDRHIRYNHRVKRASWSSGRALWSLEVETGGKAQTLTCRVLHICAGYYSYRGGHNPEFAGREDFAGQIIHPQAWPEDFDPAGKRIVVIGSGATAVTLVPSLAQTAGHVTMLQRSPTYIVSLPARDGLARLLNRLLPQRWAQSITRWKNIYFMRYFYNRCRDKPEKVKAMIVHRARKALPEGFDVETHFTPSYNPWDQRMCLVPDADLFGAVGNGQASVVTDHIDRFTQKGIRLKSGKTLEADAIVTATGLKLVVLGEIGFEVDGAAVDFSRTWIYKGMMYSGVPNLTATFGYINASWTLRADLQAAFLCRVINHMDRTGMRQATPRLRPQDAGAKPRPLIAGFSSGYVQRALALLPRQMDAAPWVSRHDYQYERRLLRKGQLEDGALCFTNPAAAAAPAGRGAPAEAGEKALAYS